MSKIFVSFDISDEFLRAVLSSAAGGCMSWADYDVKDSQRVDGGWEEMTCITVFEYGDNVTDNPEKHNVTTESIRLGIRRLVARQFNSAASHAIPHTGYSAKMYEALLENDAGMVDQELADVVLQLAIFGHLVYG